MCVRMVYTLKTNRRPIATAREMDVGLDEVGDRREEGWSGKKEDQGTHEGERRRSRDGEGRKGVL